MLVTVKLFARLRELADAGELTMELRDGATVGDAWQTLASKHREVEPYASSISCAINADYARMGAPLKHGDEVAFLPPVSGG